MIGQYAKDFPLLFPLLTHTDPWDVVASAVDIIANAIGSLSNDYLVKNQIAIHRSANVEEHVIIKSPAIIGAGCFIGAHAYLRGGVFLGDGVTIGPGCEIKSSLIMPRASLAHFNFVGDSVIGSQVNMEAGAVIANHFNERNDKSIYVWLNGKSQLIQSYKFGALVGDGSKIGANAVLSPGTILLPGARVKRLELVEQIKPA